jgi:hypothetical protein
LGTIAGRVDELIAGTSWAITWAQMATLMKRALREKRGAVHEQPIPQEPGQLASEVA